jgi:hypothetical protein
LAFFLKIYEKLLVDRDKPNGDKKGRGGGGGGVNKLGESSIHLKRTGAVGKGWMEREGSLGSGR